MVGGRANELVPFTGLPRFTGVAVFIRTARCLLCESHSAARCSLTIGSREPTRILVSHSTACTDIYLHDREEKNPTQRLSPSFTLGCNISRRSEESTMRSNSAFLSSGTSL